ncbi:MAG TPA: thioredoxin family protein, partial [Reyranella sp.]
MSNIVVPRRSLMLGGAAVALMPAIAFANGPDVGKPAPLFTAVDSNGKTWSLADLKGKVVVIETTNQ